MIDISPNGKTAIRSLRKVGFKCQTPSSQCTAAERSFTPRCKCEAFNFITECYALLSRLARAPAITAHERPLKCALKVEPQGPLLADQHRSQIHGSQVSHAVHEVAESLLDLQPLVSEGFLQHFLLHFVGTRHHRRAV